MASLSGNLLGEPFKDYVNDQIVARQKVHGKKNRTPKEIQYLNSRNAWIKLASGVFVEQKRLDLLKKNAKKAGGNNSLLQGVNEGMELALQNVLFNGLTSFGVINKNDQADNTETLQREDQSTKFRQSQRSGIKGSNRAYGVGGTSEYGYSPMPGIIDASIRDLNRGSIKKATINLKCHNRAQFDVIDVLYMRLGYTVLLEWGNDKYLNGVDSQGNGKLAQMGTTLADKEWWEKNGSSYVEALPAIEALRRKYHGNYDGIFGTISNFSWTFNDDGSYDIKLELISQGDIIESLKANLPPHQGSTDSGATVANSFDDYDKIVYEQLKTRSADNVDEFYNVLYKGTSPGNSLKEIATRWFNNPQNWQFKMRVNKYPNGVDKGFHVDFVPVDSDVGVFDFPSFNAGAYQDTRDSINQTIVQQGKGANGEKGVVEKAIRIALRELMIEASTKRRQYHNDGNEPTKDNQTVRLHLRNSQGVIRSKNSTIYNTYNADSQYRILSEDIFKEDGGTFQLAARKGASKSIKSGQSQARLQWYYNLDPSSEGDFNANKTLENFLYQFYKAFEIKQIAGGAESANQAQDEDEQLDEEALNEIENEKELEEGRFKNKMTNYLYDVRKWIEGINMELNFPITVPGLNITSEPRVIGSVANPPIINGQNETNKKFLTKWRTNVKYPTYTSSTDFFKPVDVIKLKLRPLDKQYFIRLETLLGFIEEKIIPKIETDGSLPPMLKIDTDPKKNICYAIDNMLSLDPRKTVVRVDSFYTGMKDTNGTNITADLYKGLDPFVEKIKDGIIYGNIMNIYFNFDRVEELFDDVDEKNQVSIFSILKNIADDINETLGNVNNIEPIIDKETNTVKFIDQTPIPNLSEIANHLGIPFIDRKTLPSLEIFGYDTVTPNQKGQSTFVRKAGITTSITKEYATIITIGATSNGAIPGAESTAFSKWNIGIKDRFKNELIDGEAKRGDTLKKQNDEVINKYNIFCSKPFKKLGFTFTRENFIINEDYIELNKNRAQNFYIYAQIENSKKDGHSIESSIGFLPFNLKLEMDGLSGFKIYNRVKVNTSFLPSNYGDTLDFIVTGVNHRLSNNEWVTDLETIATTKDMIS